MKPNHPNNQNKPNSGAPGANRRSGNFRGRFQRRRPRNSSGGKSWSNNSSKQKNPQKTPNKPTPVGVALMVTLNEFPKDVMTDEQLTILQDEILDAIDKSKGTGIRPQFWECTKEVGTLIVRCNNTETADWLKEIIPQLVILEGATLKVIDSVPTTKQVSKMIVPLNYPLNFFTIEQLTKLYADILKEIDKIPEGRFMPQFLGCIKDLGALKFDCNNLPSAEWLRTTVPFLEGWTESNITVLDPSDIPKRSALQLWIPGPAEEPDQVLERLERQNKGLKASEWIVTNNKTTKAGQYLYVTVEDNVLEELKKVDYNPFLNFTRIKIKRLGKYKPREKKAADDNEKVEEGDVSEDVNMTEDANNETTDQNNVVNETGEESVKEES